MKQQQKTTIMEIVRFAFCGLVGAILSSGTVGLGADRGVLEQHSSARAEHLTPQ